MAYVLEFIATVYHYRSHCAGGGGGGVCSGHFLSILNLHVV